MAVPFPLRIPVWFVDMVMAGVVVAVATVPANPLALETETLVTVPEVAGAALVQIVPFEVSTLPIVPEAVSPVPPLAGGMTPSWLNCPLALTPTGELDATVTPVRPAIKARFS
jgi:hypothetical protein